MSRRDAVLLALLVGVGALLRAPLLHEGLWRDEASTYYDAVTPTLRAALALIARTDLTPPAYFLVERAWAHVAGTGEIALKLPSFAYGLALIVATYALGRAAATSSVGLVAATFACVSQPAIALSAQARAYAFAGLLAALMLAAYARAVREPRAARSLAWFGAFAVLLVYAHYMGCVLVALLAIATPPLLWRRGEARRLPAFALAFALVAVAYAPWIPTMLAHAHNGAPWAPSASFLDRFGNDFGNLLPFASRHGQILIAFAAAALTWVVVALVRRGRRAAGTPGPMLVLGACTLGGALVGAALSLLEPRYVFVFAPAAWVWFAGLCVALVRWVARSRTSVRVVAGLVAAGLLALFVPSERAARAGALPSLSGIRVLAPGAAALARRGRTLFVLVPDYLGPTFGYYVSVPAGAVPHGFARWSDPQIFSPLGYREIWSDPGALDRATKRIAALMATQDDRLCLIRDTIIIDRGEMPYTRSDALIGWIRRRYALVSSVRAEGTEENVAMDVFSSTPARRR